ncbi:glycosyltransferase family 2 protein [Chroococcidiopsis sp. CCMEE 29]|uniref:glycosyltransferase family 2 protein n=1 Tax=Chroococcidiopsis sp. CCMEE 29 TaxID=155894 RepID=UPI002021A095|nr:glycosyltransferase family 2 protein [Chroococcidiopsis sp. CCMEE 29]
MDKLVTIGIPTYNRLHYLKEAVESALAQTYPNVEIIISQNPYKDESITQSISTWCQALARQNPKVRYQLNPRNLGSPANFNAIADAARGEYLAFIGDDDRLLPNCVEKLLKAMQPDTNLAFSNHYFINSEGKRMEKESNECTQKYGRDRLSPGEIPNSKIAAWQASVSFFACLMRTEDFQRIRFRENIGTPDWEFFILLAQEGGRFVFIPDYLSEIRRHDQTSTVAGLHFEMLVPYILPIPVGCEVEPYKRKLLSPLMIEAVSSCLLDKNIEQAKEYIHSDYYPRKSLKGQIQYLCTMLPTDLGHGLYKLLYFARRNKTYLKSLQAREFSLFPAKSSNANQIVSLTREYKTMK